MHQFEYQQNDQSNSCRMLQELGWILLIISTNVLEEWVLLSSHQDYQTLTHLSSFYGKKSRSFIKLIKRHLVNCEQEFLKYVALLIQEHVQKRSNLHDHSLLWPAKAPDLSPIEHICDMIGKALNAFTACKA